MATVTPLRAARGALLGAALALFGATAVQAQSAPGATAPPVGPGSLAGIWSTSGYKGSARNTPRERVVRTVDGKWPPLLPAASKVLEERVELATKGEPYSSTLTQCLPGGVPEMVFGSPYPVQIIESPGQVTFLYEMYNHFRVVHIGAKHPEDPDPTFMGNSVGHWERDTFVIDTIGLTDRTAVDEVGIPHSEDLHVIERYRRTDSSTLEIMLTIDDPKTFSTPWNAKVIYKTIARGGDLIEFICENNRSARE